MLRLHVLPLAAVLLVAISGCAAITKGPPSQRNAAAGQSAIISPTDAIEIQSHLQDLGYAVGPDGTSPDGRTRGSIRTYEQSIGMSPSGEYTPTLLTALRASTVARRNAPALTARTNYSQPVVATAPEPVATSPAPLALVSYESAPATSAYEPMPIDPQPTVSGQTYQTVTIDSGYQPATVPVPTSSPYPTYDPVPQAGAPQPVTQSVAQTATVPTTQTQAATAAGAAAAAAASEGGSRANSGGAVIESSGGGSGGGGGGGGGSGGGGW